MKEVPIKAIVVLLGTHPYFASDTCGCYDPARQMYVSNSYITLPTLGHNSHKPQQPDLCLQAILPSGKVKFY